MESRNNFKVIGLMSGTSLDGLDVAYCHFKKQGSAWAYTLRRVKTIPYSPSWLRSLSSAHELSGEALAALDVSYGKFLGDTCRVFLKENRLRADFIASHGHTIFHQPRHGFTYQLGNGNALYAASGIPVVCDFRSLDVLLGGEGAPLVPVGDKLLFGEFDVCLNLGGIANLSMDRKGRRVAYDICFCNMGLNYLMSTIGKAYDVGGRLSSAGEIDFPMLKKLNKVYASMGKEKRPSLGREIFERRIRPILDSPGISLSNKLRTFTASAAKEIAKAILVSKKGSTVLCTGGGTCNNFLISQVLDECGDDATLIVPDENIIKFKEALVFAFLGVLKVRGEINCYQSVTGASKNSSAGILAGFQGAGLQ